MSNYKVQYVTPSGSHGAIDIKADTYYNMDGFILFKDTSGNPPHETVASFNVNRVVSVIKEGAEVNTGAKVGSVRSFPNHNMDYTRE